MINNKVSAVVIAGLVALSASAVQAKPIMQPWCTDGRGWGSSAMTCQFETYQQCKANAGFCVANPAIDPLPQAPPDADSPRRASPPPAPRAAAARSGTVYLLENRKAVRGSSLRPGTSGHGRYDKQGGQRR